MAALLGCVLPAGCADSAAWDTTGQRRSKTPLAPPDDVFKVVSAYQPPFWKNYSPERSDRIEGFQFNLYLISRKTGRGVHTDGLLQTRMFVRDDQPDGTVQRTEVCSWTQPLTDTPRTEHEFAFGWAYRPIYYWGDTDVAGREVEIVVWFESPSGRKIYGQSQFLMVPAERYPRAAAAP